MHAALLTGKLVAGPALSMPELPEVETVRRTLQPHLLGRRFTAVLVRQPQLRQKVGVAALQRTLVGARVVGLRRRAKYLLIDVAPATDAAAQVLMVHLGMSGCLGLVQQGEALRLHDHVLWDLDDGQQLRLNDPRRFGMVDVFALAAESMHPRLVHLGVEPLDTAACSGLALHRLSRGSRAPIKSFLMNASRIVGVGNIYACEALHAAAIHPSRSAGSLSLGRWERLIAAIVGTLTAAIEQGGTTLRDFTNVRGEAGLFAVRLRAYGRTDLPCLAACSGHIRRIVQGGRSTFYCPRCQH